MKNMLFKNSVRLPLMHTVELTGSISELRVSKGLPALGASNDHIKPLKK